jgi:hypothetical protein
MGMLAYGIWHHQDRPMPSADGGCGRPEGGSSCASHAAALPGFRAEIEHLVSAPVLWPNSQITGRAAHLREAGEIAELRPIVRASSDSRAVAEI